jgi:hypothetical protein
MQQIFLRYTSSIFGGEDVLLGASFDLLKWFVAAGAAVIVIHAAYKAVAGKRTDAAY